MNANAIKMTSQNGYGIYRDKHELCEAFVRLTGKRLTIAQRKVLHDLWPVFLMAKFEPVQWPTR